MTYPPIPPGSPPQPYGYGMPPQGQYPPPTPGGNRSLLIFGAVAVVVLLAVAGIVAVVATSDSSGSPTAAGSESPDEEAIRALLAAPSLDSSSDISDAMPYFCEADQKLLEKIDDMGLDANEIAPQEPDPSSTISDIEVNGDKATARVENKAGTSKMYFRKESGEWKICMSDMPGMPPIR
ncbi:hypothetical protein [Mycobacterium hubeiense]|uniref:Rv0361 family membrane protein n=1 Tax=Mycobacterium hubeiense TaxID=1867256 RepID=UPI000C7E9C11|nr:hypothetical protein [Mycobacterium sp. QGD 101]